MTESIGSTPGGIPQAFDFQRLQRIVKLVNEEPSPYKTVDQASIGQAPPADDGNDFIVMKARGEGGILMSEPVKTEDVAKELEARGVQVGDHLDTIGGVAAKLDPSKAEDLKKEGFIVYDNRRRNLVPGIPKAPKLDDISMPKVDPLALTHADDVQKAGFTGKGQVVAVIDSGFSHPGTDLVAFKDFIDGSKKPVDPVGHGTHCAGDVLQMAPDAGIVAVRVMDEQGQGRPSDIIRGIEWATANKEKLGITAINLSLGAEPQGIPSSEDPIDLAVVAAIKKGITVVSAAGNSGPGEHTIGPPADEPLGIAVGAALNPKTVSDFSSRGPTDDGLHKPDVMAPGEFIVSWAVPGSQMEQTGQVVEKLRHMGDPELVRLLKAKPELIEGLGLPEDILQRSSAERLEILHKALPPIYMPDPGHIAAPGTSFASPIVAGIVADLKQADPKMAPQRVKDILMKTADKMGSQYGPDDQGAGFVNAEKALASVGRAAVAHA